MGDELEEFGHSSPLREATVQLHEMYIELKTAGFSKKEALHLISKIITTSLFSGIEDLDK